MKKHTQILEKSIKQAGLLNNPDKVEHMIFYHTNGAHVNAMAFHTSFHKLIKNIAHHNVIGDYFDHTTGAG